jgi:hypothetical protein
VPVAPGTTLGAYEVLANIVVIHELSRERDAPFVVMEP